ncbi:MAG: M48 family metallopeptidase [Calothrix sp. SM1_5_4]|nr:M48 family metallopeptidase [Calothrix sp. SM1_5_4]
MTKEITQFGPYTVEIWRRPYQRRMNLRVRPDGRLRVTCNRSWSLDDIRGFVDESRGFIEKRMLEIEGIRQKYPPKQGLSGETYLYMGERVPLDIIWSWNSRIRVRITEHGIEMVAPLRAGTDERLKAVHGFFRENARSLLHERVAARAKEMGVSPTRVSVRGQSTRWGSCSARREISLNWKLMAAPFEVMDYVIIHELAHIRHMDHSPKFWELVARNFPAYAEARRWLRAHETEIHVQFRHPGRRQK